MKTVPFFNRDFNRSITGDVLRLLNRYFEVNPTLSDDGASLLARPGLRFLKELGEGPVRGIYTEEGAFDNALFIAANDKLYKLTSDLTQTTIYTGLNSPESGSVNMCVTAPIEDVPEYLFFADGRNLFVYVENGYARGTLSGTPVNTDVVQIGSVYYQFTSGSVDAGSPAGTLANPWLVAVGLDSIESFDNLSAALAASGTAGTQYSTALTSNGQALGATVAAGTFVVRATAVGVLGNSVITTETGGLSWGAATLTGGGTPYTSIIEMPEDVGAFDVVTINSFVIVLPVQDGKFSGRFYWVEPGEIVVNPLNFATAERSPDPVLSVEVLGDQFWLSGSGGVEVWYVGTNPTNRMQRLQGVVFDRGTWEGTAVAINEQLIVCDGNGAVFLISGGSPERVSTADIEEQIRLAIQEQQRY